MKQLNLHLTSENSAVSLLIFGQILRVMSLTYKGFWTERRQQFHLFKLQVDSHPPKSQ